MLPRVHEVSYQVLAARLVADQAPALGALPSLPGAMLLKGAISDHPHRPWPAIVVFLVEVEVLAAPRLKRHRLEAKRRVKLMSSLRVKLMSSERLR
jgi:hypothetical protein